MVIALDSYSVAGPAQRPNQFLGFTRPSSEVNVSCRTLAADESHCTVRKWSIGETCECEGLDDLDT
jgi:hypothetical protein